jgi:hypothetical protein
MYQHIFIRNYQEKFKLKMIEHKVIRRTFGPKREKITRSWRQYHSEKLHKLYSSPNIIRMIKSRRMGWAGHVAHIYLWER